jgi:hypothetical protein
MNWGDIYLGVMFSLYIIILVVWGYLFIAGILEWRGWKKENLESTNEKLEREKYICFWCNNPLNNNMKKDVYITHKDFAYPFCSWKCAYEFIKKEIIKEV